MYDFIEQFAFQLQGTFFVLSLRKFSNMCKAASGWLRGAMWPAPLSVTCLSFLTDFMYPTTFSSILIGCNHAYVVQFPFGCSYHH